ncbi:uncharacterized protein KQ657_004136 [Scheffersomyces spartinae]|uniref:Mitochondrial 15S rRNA processing factor CCM1 n=1 Tax=Scheffersomyces spartinae TaxID=45513 RepID=A0A9P7VBK8_9ASCO|nr:uncharacterized protein KQ657_004136 [Scheffersomyces spartinae]KAG7195023.1 hypothetical protein KQ657_004136 [Scheffersomyces spartinae]
MSTARVGGQSKLKSKLQHFAQTGKVLDELPGGNTNKHFNNNKPQPYTPRKLLVLLQTRYEDKIDLKDVTVEDLSPTLTRSFEIFKKLLEVRKITGKPIDKRLLLALLGSSEDQIKDSFLVTDEVQKFLNRDDTIIRAQELARLAGDNGVMAMNEIMQWHFQKGDYKAALKCFNNRKKWGIPSSTHTYVRLFDGLSKSFEWGEAPRDVVHNAIEIFQQLRIKHAKTIKGLTKSQVLELKEGLELEVPTIEQFNAALSLAVKNYDNDQDIAWSLFDILLPEPKTGLKLMKPMGDSYTILLQGVRHRCVQEAEKVQRDPTLGDNEKYFQLLVIQKKLTDTAESILNRALEAATPPKPPTKSEAERFPEKLDKYMKNMHNMLLDIDKKFARVFVSCFINKQLGTGQDYKSCHYSYVYRGMKYLEYWSPEVGDLYDTLEGSDSTKYLIPKAEVKNIIDKKVSQVCNEFGVKEKDLLPIGEILESKVNPVVQFPPPFGPKSVPAVFEVRRRPVVDFARPTNKESRLYYLHQRYVDTNGKYGKQLPSNSYILKLGLKKKKPLSPFLLQLVFEGFYQLGRYQDLKYIFWQAIHTYGGIRVRTGLRKKINADTNVIPKRYNYYQHPKRLLKDFDKDRRNRNWDGRAIDEALLDDMLFKFSSIKGDGTTSYQSIIDFCTYVTMTERLDIDYFQDHILSAIMSELNYWCEYHRLQDKDNKDNDSIEEQDALPCSRIWKIMDGFDLIMNCFYANYNLSVGNRKFYNIENPNLTKFVDKFLARLYNVKVLKAGPEELLKTHKWFLKCGIMFYKPKELCLEEESEYFNQTIEPSIAYVTDFYKDTQKKQQGFKLCNGIKALSTVTPAQYAKWKTKKDPSEKEWYMRQKYLYLKLKLGTGR